MSHFAHLGLTLSSLTLVNKVAVVGNYFGE